MVWWCDWWVYDRMGDEVVVSVKVDMWYCRRQPANLKKKDMVRESELLIDWLLNEKYDDEVNNKNGNVWKVEVNEVMGQSRVTRVNNSLGGARENMSLGETSNSSVTFFFCQRGLAGFVTPRVTECAWSSRVTCLSNFFFKIFFCQRGLASFVTPRVTEVAWSSKVTCISNFFFQNFFVKGVLQALLLQE